MLPSVTGSPGYQSADPQEQGKGLRHDEQHHQAPAATSDSSGSSESVPVTWLPDQAISTVMSREIAPPQPKNDMDIELRGNPIARTVGSILQEQSLSLDQRSTAFMEDQSIKTQRTSTIVQQMTQKVEDCKFCEKHVIEQEFKRHLLKHKNCCALYLKLLKVKTVDKLMTKLFSCEFCCVRTRINFKRHIRSNLNCFNSYKAKYNEDDIEKLIAKVKALKRKVFPCRSDSTRQAETKKRREKKIEENRTKTVSESLTEFKDKVAFGNYRLCVQCRANFRMYGARPIQCDEELYGRLKLFDNLSLRRFQSFFICAKCEEVQSEEVERILKPSMGEKVVNETVLFYPTSEISEEEDKKLNFKNIRILFPTSINALNTGVKLGNKIKSSVRNMYKTKPVKRSTVENLYLCELMKYKVENDSQLYCGKILEKGRLEATDIKQVVSDAKVTGSSEWFKRNAAGMRCRQEQWGHVHITFKMDLPRACNEVFATCLVQEGIPITIQKNGLNDGDFDIVYMVHLDHMSDTDCSENCQNKVSLETYLERNPFDIGNAYIGTYVSSCHEKILAFVKSIVKAPSSGLCSQRYHMFMVFDAKGMASIVGSLWPDKLQHVNKEIADKRDVDEEDIISFVNNNIFCTGDKEILRSNLDISEAEAEKLGNIVVKNQVHICDDGGFDCTYCSSLPLPSLETTIKGKCSKDNYLSSEKYIKIIRNRLKKLQLEQMKKLKTSTWLRSLWEDVEADISDDYNTFTISFKEEDVTISFEVEERFDDYFKKYNGEPYTAAYHYALSCYGQSRGSFVIYQRLWIIDCLIKPFNPLFLKANNFSCEVQIVNHTWLFDQFFLPRISENVDIVDSKFHFNHRVVSCEEALALADPLIKKVYTSSKDEFVNTKENRKSSFSKAGKDDYEVYTLEGVEGGFKLLGNAISRHFDRKNLCDGLLLSETSMWYDFIGKEKSLEVSETYLNIPIPKSDTSMICSGGKLPEYILCNNGDVLKKRKEAKILTVPQTNTSREFMYCKCMLFLPIQSEDALQGDNLGTAFNTINTKGIPALEVELNEKKVMPMKIMELSEINLLDELIEALNSDVEED